MNGRIYDPLLGRFLSADLLVPHPGSLQSFNRYSYVGNNPLTLVDPSGFEDYTKEELDAIGKQIHDQHVAEENALQRRDDRAAAMACHGQDASLTPSAADAASDAADSASASATPDKGVIDSVAPAASTTPTNVTPVCFVAGTPIATTDGGFCPIEEIKVGQRVQTADDVSTQNSDTEIKPDDWRKVDLVIPNADGNGGDFELTTLMPVARIEAEGLTAGGEKQVNFSEMGIHGRAQVRSISPCPRIEPGRGRVVLSTFTRVSNGLFELRIAGLKEKIEVTGSHRLLSGSSRNLVGGTTG